MMTHEVSTIDALVHTTGWVLLHFLWQGAGIAALAGLIFSLVRPRSAGVRYAICTAALALMLLAPAATGAYLLFVANFGGSVINDVRATPGANPGAPFEGQTLSENSFAAAPPERNDIAAGLDLGRWLTPRQMNVWLSALVWLWVAGVSLLLVRMGGGWALTERLKRVAVGPAPDGWQRTLDALARRLQLSRPVRLCQSALVEAPAVVGYFRPVILVPTAAFLGLSARHLEAVLLHELAHIRRHDHLINFAQSLGETLFFYHPAVWWLSNRLRLEREHACDDLAVEATGDALIYARALAEIEELRGLRAEAMPPFALGAGGGTLLARITRLVGAAPPTAAEQRSPALLAGAVALIAVCTGAGLLSPARVAKAGDGMRRTEPLTPAPFVATAPAAGQNTAVRETNALVARDETNCEDTEVRSAARAALGATEGAVIVMDPRDGRVYSVVNQEWALRRGWTPASTIKLITGLAGVNEKLLDPAHKIRVGDRPQPIDLTEALAYSNSTYFQTIGDRLGAERFASFARQFGLGEATGVNYPQEIAGRLPSSGFDAGRMASHGSEAEITPMQLGVLVAALANGGNILVPRAACSNQKISPEVRRRPNVTPEALRQVAAGMIGAVDFGTAQGAKDSALRVAGKTGSATDRGVPLGLFASYAPADDPRLVVVVLTRGPDERGPFAAKIAGQIYRDLAKRLTASE